MAPRRSFEDSATSGRVRRSNTPVGMFRGTEMISRTQTRKRCFSQWLLREIDRFEFAVSVKQRVHGIVVAIWSPSGSEAQKKIFATIELALKLIDDVFPVRLTQIRRDFRAILVSGVKGVRRYNAVWKEDLCLCELDADYMCSPEATPADVATTIIHEFTHARFTLAGISYNEEIRAQVERACCKAQIRFAKRLAGGQPLVDAVMRNMSIDEAYWKNGAFQQRAADYLAKVGCPEWIVRVCKWIGDKRPTR